MPCQGCENEARQSEQGFENKLGEAKKYVEHTKKPVKVYKDLNEWTFMELAAPGCPTIPGRAVVSWSERDSAIQVY